jgi:DNA-binding CsgD family transcriptional regulator
MRSLHLKLSDAAKAQSGFRCVNVEAPTFALCHSDRERRKKVMSSPRRDHRNFGAIGQVEGVLKTVDLSAMEFKVLDLMRLSKTTKDIAEKLCISQGTVALHIRHSLRRLRARSAQELLSQIREYH